MPDGKTRVRCRTIACKSPVSILFFNYCKCVPSLPISKLLRNSLIQITTYHMFQREEIISLKFFMHMYICLCLCRTALHHFNLLVKMKTTSCSVMTEEIKCFGSRKGESAIKPRQFSKGSQDTEMSL